MHPAKTEPASPSEQHWFATTRWGVVLNAADSVAPGSSRALEELCRSYWYPLYAYVRRRGHDPESAKDLTQEFFAQLLAKRLLHAVDPAKGRFRAWLLGVMKHFLAHEWTKARAQRRGGSEILFSLDEVEAEDRYRLEPSSEADSEKIFDRRWAFTVLNRAAARLREEYQDSGKADVYAILKGFVAIEGSSMGYQEASERLQWSESALKSAVFRLRQRYHDLIRDEIGQTVASAVEVDDEIRYLLAIIRT